MNLMISVVGIIFALFSSMILAYVSIVTMIGPWIAPTLVLVASILLKFRFKRKPHDIENKEIALIQTVGSVGALVAVALGFTLPTLYFLDEKLFNSWLAAPVYFCGLVTAAVLSSGILGMYLAKMFGEKLIYRDKLKFPVSLLIHKMITSQSQGKQVRNMFTGFFSSAAFCFVRDGIFHVKGLLPKTLYLFPSMFGRELALSMFNGPTLLAVGFTTGAVIATPLIVGMLSKYLVLYPINNHSLYLPFNFFAVQNSRSFTIAFCSGLVLAEAALGVTRYPKIIWNTVKGYINVEKIKKTIREIMLRNMSSGIVEVPSEKPNNDIVSKHNIRKALEAVLVLSASFAFLTYLKFSILSQIFILSLTIIATYQISIMGGTIGLIPFGRFATFVMIPTMLLFKLDYVQITFLCVFVNVSSAVASDLLFDYKVGELCGIKFKRIRQYQWLGLIITALSMGGILWLLFTSFQIGTPELFAQRGKTRALLVLSIFNATAFNYKVLIAGALYGYGLKRLKVSPALVLGGILMPNNISIGLILGGLGSKLFKNPESHFPLWSGVFAGESTWVLSIMLLKLLGN